MTQLGLSRVEAPFSIGALADSVKLASSRRFSKAERIWVFRSLLAPIASIRWNAFIGRLYEQHARAAPPTAVLSRPLRNFGRQGLSPGQRVSLLCRHHVMMGHAFRPDLLSRIFANAIVDLAVLESKGSHFRLGLCSSSTHFNMPREGELVFFFENTDTGTVLAKKSVFLGRVDEKPVAIIGGVQGTVDAKTAVIYATRRMHGLRPKDAVLLAVRAFANASGLTEVHAVSNAAHVITAGNKQRKFSDYDDYWTERGAVPAAPYGFSLPSQVDLIEGGKGRDQIKRRIVEAVSEMTASWRA